MQSDEDEEEEEEYISSTDEFDEDEEGEKQQLKRLGMGDPQSGFLQVVKKPRRGRPREYESSLVDDAEKEKTGMFLSDSL
jgi:hypothetical protein